MLASAPLTSAPICSAPVFPDASLGAAVPDGAMLAFMQQLGQQQQQPPPPQRIQTAQPLHHQVCPGPGPGIWLACSASGMPSRLLGSTSGKAGHQGVCVLALATTRFHQS